MKEHFQPLAGNEILKKFYEIDTYGVKVAHTTRPHRRGRAFRFPAYRTGF
ncbi:MAG: hypothetical protein V7K88_32575 [Nostoc sp.]